MIIFIIPKNKLVRSTAVASGEERAQLPPCLIFSWHIYQLRQNHWTSEIEKDTEHRIPELESWNESFLKFSPYPVTSSDVPVLHQLCSHCSLHHLRLHQVFLLNPSWPQGQLCSPSAIMMAGEHSRFSVLIA